MHTNPQLSRTSSQQAWASMLRLALTLALTLTCSVLVSCGDPVADPELLSEWNLFTDFAQQTPAEGVVPYEVNAPLFSDYASKHRFIRVPEGMQITIDEAGHFVFPEGTVVAKTFGFYADLRYPSLGERLIETRLLVRESARWRSIVYVYDADMQEARIQGFGSRVNVAFIDAAGEDVSLTYRVPNTVQCGNCHGGTGETELLGVPGDQLDRLHAYDGVMTNQLDHFVALGWLNARPAVPVTMPNYADAAVPLNERARSYLDANCSHCHREHGAAHQSGLWLTYAQPEGTRTGICKPPVAAGRGTGGRFVAISPGSADESIMVFRMESAEPGIKMPELPTVLVHTEGAALIREWIDAMPAVDCTP